MVMDAFALMHEPSLRLLHDRDPKASGIADTDDVLRDARRYLARPRRADVRGAASETASAARCNSSICIWQSSALRRSHSEERELKKVLAVF